MKGVIFCSVPEQKFGSRLIGDQTVDLPSFDSRLDRFELAFSLGYPDDGRGFARRDGSAGNPFVDGIVEELAVAAEDPAADLAASTQLHQAEHLFLAEK